MLPLCWLSPGSSGGNAECPQALTRSADGHWVAWIECDSVPIQDADGQPQLFPGDTGYQAQCKATRWLRDQASVGLRCTFPPLTKERLRCRHIHPSRTPEAL